MASSYPEVAANPASPNLPRSQAGGIWEARQLSALVSFVKLCRAFLFTRLLELTQTHCNSSPSSWPIGSRLSFAWCTQSPEASECHSW